MSYRRNSNDSDDSVLSALLQKFGRAQAISTEMDEDQLQAIIQTALSVQAAEYVRREADLKAEFKRQIDELSGRVSRATISVPVIKVYEDAQIIPGIRCDEPLDAMKSLPEFTGSLDAYVAWRQAAHNSYKIFKNYDGSSRHYQAMVILRNKIRGSADAVLASFNTALNFEAIIARLDFTYADKKPIHIIEQEMGTLRQGSMSTLEYYDEVEKKLTLLTNKTNMTYDHNLAKGMCEKFRGDALRVFISGLRRNLTDVLFAAHPPDLPSALALAQEVEANHDRYNFATNFARGLEERSNRGEMRNQSRQNPNQQEQRPNAQAGQGRSPAFKKQRGQRNAEAAQVAATTNNNRSEPMDVDPSMSKYRQQTAYQKSQESARVNPQQGQTNKRSNTSDRMTGQRRQRIDHISTNGADKEGSYNVVASKEVEEIDTDSECEGDSLNFLDSGLNFLGRSPCCRTYGDE